MFVDSWTSSTGLVLAVTLLPIAIAIAITGVAIDGRRGALVAVVLAGMVGYWTWWFGWGLTWNISPFSIGMAASGMADGVTYLVVLLVNLWPLVFAMALAAGVIARRRGRPVGPALGLLCLSLIVLSFPSRATWSDTCNGTTGAAPLITRPFTQPLMDHGIGVLPGGMQTLVGCSSTADRDWKPFWLGDDYLPPPPGLYDRTMAAGVSIPTHLYRAPFPLPGRRLDRVSLAYWPERDTLSVVVATNRRLGTARPPAWPPVDLRINGVKFDDDDGLGEEGSDGWCYSAVWVSNPRLPEHRPGTMLRVDLEYKGQRLASGRARVRTTSSEDQDRFQGRQFGCPPKR